MTYPELDKRTRKGAYCVICAAHLRIGVLLGDYFKSDFFRTSLKKNILNSNVHFMIGQKLQVMCEDWTKFHMSDGQNETTIFMKFNLEYNI